MIKRYNQFVNGRINENIEEVEADLDTDLEQDLDQELDNLPTEDIDIEEEEEAGDIYTKKLQEVAELLGAQVEGGKVNFEGKEIIFPSETEMYHVDKKKFKTTQEVVDYLKK